MAQRKKAPIQKVISSRKPSHMYRKVVPSSGAFTSSSWFTNKMLSCRLSPARCLLVGGISFPPRLRVRIPPLLFIGGIDAPGLQVGVGIAQERDTQIIGQVPDLLRLQMLLEIG